MRIGCVACAACWGLGMAAQPLPPTGGWGLDDVVLRACQSSPDALAARHTFRSAYWDYRSFRADYLPSLTLTSGPNLDRSINQITMEDGSVRFVEQNLLNNNLKWRRRIEPVRYEEAQRSYLETMELVAARAVDKFFALAMAQSNYATACQNFAHADTLYRFAQGRYQIGTTTENEMLQLEINRLNEETNRLNARIEMDECALDLRSYLGLHEGDTLPAIRMVTEVPDVMVEEGAALQWAHLHSPDILYMKRRKLEAESNVAQAKANAGLKADLYLRFGLTQTAENFSSTYRHPLDQQAVSIGITLPILDWGKGRGQVRVARSQRDLVETQVEQSRTDFDQNIRKLVGQFNLQGLRVRVAARTDSTALRRSEVARRLYVLGKSSVLDLNASIEEKDAARRNYLNALHTYWSLYYTLRSLTLYDFFEGRPLQVDYGQLVKD